MSLRKELNSIIEDVSEWYATELDRLLALSQQDEYPLFTEPIPESEEKQILTGRTDADWMKLLQTEGPEPFNKQFAKLLEFQRKGD
jgi:hypothetical protein